MKTFLKLSLVIIFIFFTGSCSMNKKIAGSKAVFSSLSDNATIKDGSLIYGLPLTVINVKVETERVIEKPGPYARYAGDMLGLTDVIRNETENWSIKSVAIQTHQELDPSEFYVIRASSIFHTNMLSLKKAGLIMDLNPESFYQGEERYPDRAAGLNHLRVFDLGADEYFQARNDTAYRLINVDTTFIRIPYLVEKKQKLSMAQLADRAARRLMELRDGKHLILTGEANVFPQSEAAINEINRLEKDYTELFSGKIWKENKTFIFQIIPRKNMTGKQVILFRFSENTGPAADGEKTGTPVMIEFLPEEKTKKLTVVQKQTGSSTSKFDKLFYRVPDVVAVKITLESEILSNSRQLIYQFGEVVQLHANFIIGR